MKQILTIVLSLIGLSNLCYSQNIKNIELPYCLYTNESKMFVYDTVINVAGVSKDELYKRSKDWVISTVRTSDKTVIFDDQGLNEIRTDVTLGIPIQMGTSDINFKLSIYLKDNKVRFVTESFQMHYLGTNGVYDMAFEKLSKFVDHRKLYKKFDLQFPALVDSYVKSLSKAKKADW